MDELQKEHELRVVASGRAAGYLAETVSGVHEIWGLTFAKDGAEVRMLQTLIQNLRGAAPGLAAGHRASTSSSTEDFKPDVVVSDFESFSELFAKRHRVPDHQPGQHPDDRPLPARPASS